MESKSWLRSTSLGFVGRLGVAFVPGSWLAVNWNSASLSAWSASLSTSYRLARSPAFADDNLSAVSQLDIQVFVEKYFQNLTVTLVYSMDLA